MSRRNRPAAASKSAGIAPAFNAERLSSLPRDEWITNGGTIANQRYSPLDNGARLYREACLPCHGPTGGGGEGAGAALTRGLTRQAALGVIAAGRNTMPAFRASYAAQELRDLAAYVAERFGAGQRLRG